MGDIVRRNCLLKQVIEEEAERTEIQETLFLDVRHPSVLFSKSNCIENEDVSSYYMTLRKREDTATCKRRHYIALCAERILEGNCGLSGLLRGVVISHRRFGTTYLSHLQVSKPEDRADRLYRNVGEILPLLAE
jgi:hypothetical protein